MNSDIKKRLVIELKKAGALLLVAFLYYLFTITTDMGIPCMFRKITGLLCPGCGISRMLIAITRFEFLDAINYNPVCFFGLPIFGLVILRQEYLYIKFGKRKMSIMENVILVLFGISLLIFGILRNIY